MEQTVNSALRNLTQSSKRILLLGAGTMGRPMAKNLASNNFEVVVLNRTFEHASHLHIHGIKVLNRVSELKGLDKFDIVLSILSDDHASKHYFFETNLIEYLHDKTVVIECSTLSYAYIQNLYKHLSSKNIQFMDAPVSGTKPHAENMNLTFFVGASEQDFQPVLGVFNCLGDNFVYTNSIGGGIKLKLINNILNAAHVLALAEVYNLSNQIGICPENFHYIITKGSPSSPITQLKGERLLHGDQEVQAKISLLKKDLSYASELFKSSENPVLTFLLNQYSQADEKGLGNLDVSDIFKR